jgi:hypothetical protein
MTTATEPPTKTPFRGWSAFRSFKPAPGMVVRHFKGGLYHLTKVVNEQYKITVFYEDQAGAEFSRPIREFYHEVQVQPPLDVWVPRFMLLSEAVTAHDFRQLEL